MIQKIKSKLDSSDEEQDLKKQSTVLRKRKRVNKHLAFETDDEEVVLGSKHKVRKRLKKSKLNSNMLSTMVQEFNPKM